MGTVAPRVLDHETRLTDAAEAAIVAAWGVVSFAVALKIFRWR
jgi:hypothetical protein